MPGGPSKLNEAQRRALAKIAESGPIPAIHGVVWWWRNDLAQWIYEDFGMSLDETTVGSELEGARLCQALGAAASLCPERVRGGRFHKRCPTELAAIQSKLPQGTEIELC